jgi:hypothetical protein
MMNMQKSAALTVSASILFLLAGQFYYISSLAEVNIVSAADPAGHNSTCFQLFSRSTDLRLSVRAEDLPWPASGGFSGRYPGWAAAFRIVPAVLSTEFRIPKRQTVSLESCRYPGRFLRFNGDNIVVEELKVPADAVWLLSNGSNGSCLQLNPASKPDFALSLSDPDGAMGRAKLAEGEGTCLDMIPAPSYPRVSDTQCSSASNAIRVASMADGEPCKLIPRIACVGETWELGEHKVCKTESFSRSLRDGTCLMYGFGVADDWNFEVAVAKMGCEVHAFDPTIETPPTNDADQLKNLHFHRWGLSGVAAEGGAASVVAGVGDLF